MMKRSRSAAPAELRRTRTLRLAKAQSETSLLESPGISETSPSLLLCESAKWTPLGISQNLRDLPSRLLCRGASTRGAHAHVRPASGLSRWHLVWIPLAYWCKKEIALAPVWCWFYARHQTPHWLVLLTVSCAFHFRAFLTRSPAQQMDRPHAQSASEVPPRQILTFKGMNLSSRHRGAVQMLSAWIGRMYGKTAARRQRKSSRRRPQDAGARPGIVVGVRVCVYACMRVCVYAYMRVCVYACMRVCAYARMRVCAYARMRVCAYARMRVCAYARMRVCAYARVCVCVCMGVCVCVCKYACMRVCVR